MKATLKYLSVLILILLVTILQDYLYDQKFDHSIYDTENRLINSLWILIFPVSILWNVLFKKVRFLARIHIVLIKRLLFIILATVTHILAFAGLADFIATNFFEQNLPFLINIRFTISVDLYKYLLIYSIIALILVRKNKNVKSR
ncbi:hypothetical protein [Algoriphagus machipongonensis]|nr:hypothetical protein [Algoriphagus machipongonensis]